MSLSSIIVQREIATMRQVEEALARQVLYGGDLVTNLLEVASVDEAKIVEVAAEVVAMRPAPSGVLPSPEPRAKAMIPAELAARRSLYPLAVADEHEALMVAVAEPLPADEEEQLTFALGVPLVQCIAPLVRIRQALAREFGAPLDRRHERLILRLHGDVSIASSSLPPLLRDAPSPHVPPRPPSVFPYRASNPGFLRFEPGAPSRIPTNEGFPAVVPPREVAVGVAHVPQGVGVSSSLLPPPPNGEAALPLAVAAALDPNPMSRSIRPFVIQEEVEAQSVGEGSAVRAVRPETLVRESRIPNRPPRRRRGPLTFATARAELEEVTDRDTLLELFFDFSRQYFEYTALFIVQGDLAEGREAFGNGASRDRVSGIGVPLDMPSLFATARDMASLIVAEPNLKGLDAVLIKDLERRAARAVLVAPLVVRSRVVALLYGDAGDVDVERDLVSDVSAFALLAGQSFERLILKRKRGSFAPAEVGSHAGKIVDPARIASKLKSRQRQPELPEQRAERALALGRALLGGDAAGSEPRPSSAPPPSVPPERHFAAEVPVPTESALLDAAWEPAPITQPEHPEAEEPPSPPEPPPRAAEAGDDAFGVPPRRLSRDSLPPANVTVRPIAGPPIPREEPTDATGRAPERVFSRSSRPPSVRPPANVAASERPQGAVREERVSFSDRRTDPDPFLPPARISAPPIIATATVVIEESPRLQIEDAFAGEEQEEDEDWGDPPPSQIIVPPRTPPTPHTDGEALPSVIVDVSRELEVFVERYLADADDDQAEGELLREGHQAMPVIMARFPGPIHKLPKDDEDGAVPVASASGPILRLIAMQRRVALPWVLEHVDSRNEDKRFWATFLLGELAYAEAIPRLLPRLLDESERVRRAARWAAAGVARHHGEEVAREFGRLARDPSAPAAKRLAMLEVLEAIREPLAVPTFIAVLNDEYEDLAVAARRALLVVARQDFGRDTRRWTQWWNAHSSRDRIEWLIDALVHESQAVRRAAGEELKAITKEYFGYYDDLPKRDRERAQARYHEWWATEGRARFTRPH